MSEEKRTLISLTITVGDNPERITRVVETLSRTMAGFALEGVGTNLYVSELEDDMDPED